MFKYHVKGQDVLTEPNHTTTMLRFSTYSESTSPSNIIHCLLLMREREGEKRVHVSVCTCTLCQCKKPLYPLSLPPYPLSLSLLLSPLVHAAAWIDQFPLVIDPELIALALTAVSSSSWYYWHWLVHSLMLLDKNHNRLWLDNCSSHNLGKGESGNNTCISKTKEPRPPKLVFMHLTSIPTCMNFLSQFWSIKF